MRSICQATVVVAFIGLGCTAASAAQAPAQPPVHLENGSILYAELEKTVDAKKAKVGDPVKAVLTADVLAHGKIVVRHDAKLLGHVTEVQIYTKEVPESRLGIIFDKAVTKGREVPFQSVLLAIRPGERPAVEIPMAPSLGNSAQRPYPSPPGSTPPYHDPSLNDPLRPRDRAVPAAPTDIDGLSLSPADEGGSHTVVSTKRTVRLESGIKIELLVMDQ